MKSLMNMTTADHGGSLGPVCAGESTGNIRRRVADGAASSSAEPGVAGRYRLPAGSRSAFHRGHTRPGTAPGHGLADRKH